MFIDKGIQGLRTSKNLQILHIFDGCIVQQGSTIFNPLFFWCTNVTSCLRLLAAQSSGAISSSLNVMNDMTVVNLNINALSISLQVATRQLGSKLAEFLRYKKTTLSSQLWTHLAQSQVRKCGQDWNHHFWLFVSQLPGRKTIYTDLSDNIRLTTHQIMARRWSLTFQTASPK